jgi:hypothetical protein
MGLMYLFPVSLEEADHAKVDPQPPYTLTLKSYGLPGIFWFYLVSILSVIAVMFFLVKGPLDKILLTQDPLNVWIGRIVYLTLIATPLGLLSIFFYQKKIIKTQQTLIMQHSLFGLTYQKQLERLHQENPFSLRHFMDSPNLARMRQEQKMEQYMNKGYFELWGKREDGTQFFIDRHSRKMDLVKIKNLLEKF